MAAGARLPLDAAAAPGTRPAAGHWDRLPSVPDAEGFAGSLAGVVGAAADGARSPGTLLVAGGTNFPDKKPWEGGRKVWTDAVFALDRPDGQWRVAGRLPRRLGYGVSATHGGSVVCVGGSDADRHYGDVFRLTLDDRGNVVTTPLPPLPRPIANACGAIVGNVLYVAGGLGAPDARQTLRTVYRLDLASPDRWREVEPWPGGGRMLAVAAATPDGSFWVAGGADLVAEGDRAAEGGRIAAGGGGKVVRRYLRDAYRLHPGGKWERVADLPRAAVAAPSPAPADAGGFVVVGGDDGTQVDAPPDRHHGFERSLLRYDAKANAWTTAGEWETPRVTTACVRWAGRWVIPGGEARPGVRSPDVWAWDGR